MGDRHFSAIPVDKRLVNINFPTTPHNSLTSTPSGLEPNHELPSFNNAEMVQRIHEKKRKLGNFDNSENNMSFPFTPQNSTVDSPFENFAREHNLPSFCNAEMVDRIRVKRKSLDMLREEGIAQSSMDDGHADSMEDAFGLDPFTPSNSVTDHKFDEFAKEVSLPSMRNSETVKQIREKREKLKQNVLQNAGFPSEEGEGLLIDFSADVKPLNDNNQSTHAGASDDFNISGDFYDFEKSADFTPFTPQNSATGQMFDHFAHEHDLPSFNSAAMVEKICKKKNTLPREPCASNAINALKSVPFTPQNSYTNLGTFAPLGQRDKFLSEGFMFDPDELVSRVATKRKMSECLDFDAIDDGASCSSTDEEVMFAFQGDLPGEAPLGELEKASGSSSSSGSASLSAYENFMCGVSSSDEGLSRYNNGETEASNLNQVEICNNFVKGVLESAIDIVRSDQSKPVIDNVVGQSQGLIHVDDAGQSSCAVGIHDSCASSGSASLSAYDNFMCGVSSSDEGLSRHIGGQTGASNSREVAIVHDFVEGILESAIDIVRNDQLKPVIDNVVGQSQGTIQVDVGQSGDALVDRGIDLSQCSDDIGESAPLLDTITNMVQSERPRHDTHSKKTDHSLKSTRVRFSVDDEELSKDAYAEMIADEIAGDDDVVVPIGGVLQINHMDTLEQSGMFTHNWADNSSCDSSDSEGHAKSYDVNQINKDGGSYDVDALNQDVIKNIAQTFVDDIIKDACDKYQNEAQEAALKKVADEFVAGVLKRVADEYIQSCDEAANEFCAELIRQALDEFAAPDKNDASDDTGIFDASDGFISPAGERLGKLSSIDSETSNGPRKGTPKSLSLDSPFQFNRHENIDSDGNISAKKLKKNLSEPTPGFGRRLSDLDLETEYLCSYDPLFGNMEIVSSPDHSFATDATRDIAENESFKRMRKESGIFDDSDGEDMSSLKKFLELRAMQEHFVEKDASPSGVESMNYNVPAGAANHSAPPGGSVKNFKVPSGGNSVNFNLPPGGSLTNYGSQNNNRVNCYNYQPTFRRHSDTGPAGRSRQSSRPSAGISRRECAAHDSGIDRGADNVNATSGGRGSNTWARGDPAWDKGSHGVVETCDIDILASDEIKQGVLDGDKLGLGEVGENGARLEKPGFERSRGIRKAETGLKFDQTWISGSDATATETDALLDKNDHDFPETEKPERHFGVNSAVSDADACEDLSEREDSEVFLDDSAAALLGSAAGSRRSSAKFSASSARTWSSLGSRSSKSDFGSTSDPGVTFGDYVRDLFIHVRRHNGDIVVLRKTFLQDKMSKLGIKMEKASQKEIFYTTAGRISIQVDSFPEFLEDGTRVIDEDGFVQLLGGRYEISQDLLDSADRLCKKIDEIKENEQRMNEGENTTNVDDVLRDIASSTPKKTPDVVHDTEDSDGEDNNNESKKFSRPSTLETSGSFRRKIRVKNLEELDFRNERFPSFGEADAMSNDDVDLDKTFDPDDIQTPDELDTPDLEALGVSDSDLDDDDESTTPEGDSDNAVEPIPEYTATEEFQESRNWRKVTIADKTYKIDMKVIEPYKKVLSHGGYYGDGLNAIIIFASCYLPDKGRPDYNYVMDNLFLYVISTLELLVAEDYMIVYFHGSTPRTRMPNFGWMKRCYQIIDRRLRKNLKGLLLVHPTFWLKTVILMTRPFISTKFSSKVKFIHSLKELGDVIPMEYVFVPDQVKRYDALMRKRRAVSSSSASSPATPVSSR